VSRPLYIGMGAALIGAFVLGRFTAEQPGATHVEASATSGEVFRTSLAEALGNRRDPLQRAGQLVSLMQVLGTENVGIATEVFEEYVFSTPEHEIALFMEVWSRFDAPGALARAMTWPEKANKRVTAVSAAIRAWARREPLSAQLEVQHLLGEVDNSMRRPLLAGLASGWIQSDDKTGATRFVAAHMDNDKSRTRMAKLLIAEIRRSGSDAELRAWAEEIPDDEETRPFKAVAFRSAAVALARDDPRAAALWVGDHVDRNYALGALRGVALEWAMLDPAAALDWLLDQPVGKTRRNVIVRVYTNWVREEPEPARAWLAATELPVDLRSTLVDLPPQTAVAPKDRGAARRPGPRE